MFMKYISKLLEKLIFFKLIIKIKIQIQNLFQFFYYENPVDYEDEKKISCFHNHKI